MNDYTELDAAILKRLQESRAGFHALSAALESIAEPLCKPDRFNRVSSWRVVDRRLQSLRKAGRVRPVRVQGQPMWELA